MKQEPSLLLTVIIAYHTLSLKRQESAHGSQFVVSTGGVAMIPQDGEVQRRKVFLQIGASGSAPAAVHQESVMQPNLTSAQVLFLILEVVEKEYSLSTGRFVSTAHLWCALRLQKGLVQSFFPSDYFLTVIPTQLFLSDLEFLIAQGIIVQRPDNGLMIRKSGSAAYRSQFGALPLTFNYVVPQLIRRMKRSYSPTPVHHVGIERVDVTKLK